MKTIKIKFLPLFFILIIIFAGCASSVSPVLKYPLLKDGEDFAIVTVKQSIPGPRTMISEFIIVDSNGDKKAYLPISNDSIGTEAFKAAYAWTPWGVATRIVHMNKGAIYHIPPIEMSIKLESNFWEGPIRTYYDDKTKYEVWRVHKWNSFINNVRLEKGKEYALNTPEKLYGEPILVNLSKWSTILKPNIEISDAQDEEISVDGKGNKIELKE